MRKLSLGRARLSVTAISSAVSTTAKTMRFAQRSGMKKSSSAAPRASRSVVAGSRGSSRAGSTAGATGMTAGPLSISAARSTAPGRDIGRCFCSGFVDLGGVQVLALPIRPRLVQAMRLVVPRLALASSRAVLRALGLLLGRRLHLLFVLLLVARGG